MKKSARGKRAGLSAEVAPVGLSFRVIGTQPRFQSTSAGEVLRVHHRELAGTLSTIAGGFNQDPVCVATPGYDLNPGSGRLFPWLSSIANLFEQYRFGSVVFRAVPAQATTVPGRVYMGVDLDYDDEVPTVPMQIMANRLATEGSMWTMMELNCPGTVLMRDQTWKFCSTVSRVDPEPRTSYCGFLCFGAISSSAGVWDLWIEYDVEFRSPCLEPNTVLGGFNLGPSTPAAANMLTCTGADAGANPYACPMGRSVSSGPSFMSEGLAGYGGIPVLATSLMNAAGRAGLACYDVAPMVRLGSGIVEWFGLYGLTGRTPATQLPLSQYKGGVEFFDSKGTKLHAGIHDTTLVLSPPGNTWSTAGQDNYVRSNWGFYSSFMTQYPTLRYMIVWLISLSAYDTGAGTVLWSWQAKL